MKHIALIEDNPDNRLLVQALFGDTYRIDEYENGRTGLAGLRRERPDLVLLDISLPEMDGMEVLANVRKDPDMARLPVIALTAHAMQGDRERFLAAGFDECVTKPILDNDALGAMIERLMERN